VGQRLLLAAGVLASALALSGPAGAAMVPLDLVKARAVAHAYLMTAAKNAKVDVGGVLLECSEVRTTKNGPAVYTYFTAGTEKDAVVVVRVGRAYKVAGITKAPSFDCGPRYELAA
jgi:hypothetical protein